MNQQKKNQETGNQLKPKKKKSAARVFGNILFYLLIIVLLLIGILGIISKVKKQDTIGLFGTHFYVVATGSMATVHSENADFLEGHTDQIQVGDLIVTHSIKDESELQVYSIVTYINENGATVVHRIVRIEKGADGNLWYTTRGDANSVSDAKRTSDQFTGILVADMGESWGEAVKFMQSYYGIAATAGIVAVILIFILINDAISKKEARKAAEAAKTAQELEDLKYVPSKKDKKAKRKRRIVYEDEDDEDDEDEEELEYRRRRRKAKRALDYDDEDEDDDDEEYYRRRSKKRRRYEEDEEDEDDEAPRRRNSKPIRSDEEEDEDDEAEYRRRQKKRRRREEDDYDMEEFDDYD